MTAAYAQIPQPIPATHADARSAGAAASQPSKKMLWSGRILSGLAVLFLLFDATVKVLQLPPALQGTAQLGYPASVVFPLGILQLVCLVVYLIPRTAVLGAILWTGYLGGAIATHGRVGIPLFSHILFPLYVSALLLSGLSLRDERARSASHA